MNFILTQIGSKKADYIVECIRQLHFFNNTNIYLVSNNYHKQLLIKKNLLKKIIFINEDQIKKNNKHNIFLKNTKLDGKFYNQFWIKTCNVVITRTNYKHTIFKTALIGRQSKTIKLLACLNK